MQIDGYDVKPGEKLWHVVLGEGTVTEITPEGAIRVTFAQANYLFNSNLRRPGERVRTLYHQNPIHAAPPPASEALKYQAFRNICKTVWTELVGTPFVEA